MDIEAVLLTGGASRRMGTDKASLEIKGKPLAQIIAERLSMRGIPVTVLGREPIQDHDFVQDQEDYAGPLAALANYHPKADNIFVAACDMPLFDARIVEVLGEAIGCGEAAIPSLHGRLQPLCAIYSAAAIEKAKELAARGERRIMAWVDTLQKVLLDEEALRKAGIDVKSLRSANTPEELAELLA